MSSSNKIISTAAVSNPTPVPLAVLQPAQQQSALAAESAKKMARKDKEFLTELDSQVKGQF